MTESVQLKYSTAKWVFQDEHPKREWACTAFGNFGDSTRVRCPNSGPLDAYPIKRANGPYGEGDALCPLHLPITGLVEPGKEGEVMKVKDLLKVLKDEDPEAELHIAIGKDRFRRLTKLRWDTTNNRIAATDGTDDLLAIGWKGLPRDRFVAVGRVVEDRSKGVGYVHSTYAFALDAEYAAKAFNERGAA